VTAHRSGRIPGHTPEPELAAEQGITVQTQRKKRRRGDCPAYIIVGRQVHYVDEDKLRYYESLRVTPPRPFKDRRREPAELRPSAPDRAAPAMPKRGRGRPRRGAEVPAPAGAAS
jgi:hypothetical protein